MSKDDLPRTLYHVRWPERRTGAIKGELIEPRPIPAIETGDDIIRPIPSIRSTDADDTKK